MKRLREHDDDIRQLLAQLDEPEHDARAGYFAVLQKIKTLTEDGTPIPKALEIAERQLRIELNAQSQGR